MTHPTRLPSRIDWELTAFYCSDCDLNYCAPTGTPRRSSMRASTTAPSGSARRPSPHG